jgi:hypothetical protein
VGRKVHRCASLLAFDSLETWRGGQADVTCFPVPFQVDQEMLFEIILAANYLDIKPLLWVVITE